MWLVICLSCAVLKKKGEIKPHWLVGKRKTARERERGERRGRGGSSRRHSMHRQQQQQLFFDMVPDMVFAFEEAAAAAANIDIISTSRVIS